MEEDGEKRMGGAEDGKQSDARCKMRDARELTKGNVGGLCVGGEWLEEFR